MHRCFSEKYLLNGLIMTLFKIVNSKIITRTSENVEYIWPGQLQRNNLNCIMEAMVVIQDEQSRLDSDERSLLMARKEQKA